MSAEEGFKGNLGFLYYDPFLFLYKNLMSAEEERKPRFLYYDPFLRILCQLKGFKGNLGFLYYDPFLILI